MLNYLEYSFLIPIFATIDIWYYEDAVTYIDIGSAVPWHDDDSTDHN